MRRAAATRPFSNSEKPTQVSRGSFRQAATSDSRASKTDFSLNSSSGFITSWLTLMATASRFRSKKALAASSDANASSLGIIATSVAVISANIYPLYSGLGESVRLAAFQVASIITTTGYATADFNLWPSLSKAILLMLMFMGACAGSTGGGLKVSRAVILFQMAKQEIRRAIHPRAVSVVRLDGKAVDTETQHSTAVYFMLYCLCMIVPFLILSFEPFDFETNFSATVACFNNIGPGFNMVGAAGNYSAYSNLSKIVLSLTMLMGRLEIYPLLLTFIPSGWHRR